jgi:segregation and condensation protein B
MNQDIDKKILQRLDAEESKIEAIVPVVVDKGLFPVTGTGPVDAANADVASVPTPTERQIVEALLFAAPAPVVLSRLCEITGSKPEMLNATIDELNREYEAAGRAFRIQRVAQGLQLFTLPDFAEWVRQLFKTPRATRLSRASLETLAIIAYRQPVTKPEVEQLRGVDATAPLMTLLERRLIVIAGRAHKPGNPFLYRTSREFLRYFGLADIDLLPSRDELEGFLRARAEQAEKEDLGLLAGATPESTATESGSPPGSVPDADGD